MARRPVVPGETGAYLGARASRPPHCYEGETPSLPCFSGAERSMTALRMRSCHNHLTWERGRPARMQARCLRYSILQPPGVGVWRLCNRPTT